MAKKDFTAAKTDRVYNQIAEATADTEPAAGSGAGLTQGEQETQDTQEPRDGQQGRRTQKPRREYYGQEAQELQQAGKTQGRKGCKMVRINMAFEPDLHDFIRTMARVRGETVTDLTNHVFRQYMEDNMDVYKKAMEFRDSL